MEHVHGILLDEKFLYRSVHAAFVNTNWYEAWLERTLLLDPIILTCGSRVCSRGRQASLVTAITQDTLVKTQSLFRICVLVLSSITSRSVAAAAASSLMRFSPSPSCRGDAANPWLESAFITHFGCVSRHLFVCSQSIAIACVSRRVSPLLVFPAEYRHCFCFPQSIAIACVSSVGLLSWQLMMILQCFHPKCLSDRIFGYAVHARSVRRWCWSAASCSTGGGDQSRVAPCTDSTSSAPMATCPCFRVLLRQAQHAHAVFTRMSDHGPPNPQFLSTSITKIDGSCSSSSDWRCARAGRAFVTSVNTHPRGLPLRAFGHTMEQRRHGRWRSHGSTVAQPLRLY